MLQPRSRWNRSTPRLIVLSCLAFGLVALANDRAAAQVDRNQLGKRLQRLEQAWQQADAASRARTTAPLQAAVKSFFALQFRSAAAQLDEAYFLVRPERAAAPTEFDSWAVAQRLEVAPLLMDTSTTELRVSLKPYYQTKAAAGPANTKVRMSLLGAAQQPVAERVCKLEELVEGVAWDVGKAPAGDYVLTARLESAPATPDGGAGKAVELLPAGLSRADRLTERLAKIEAELKRLQSLPDPHKFRGIRESDGAGAPRRSEQEIRDSFETARATVTGQHAILKALAEGKVQEIDYPAEWLLRTCEDLLAIPDLHEQRVAREARASDVWLTLVEGASRVEVRMRAPAATVRSGPLPVLVLYHGAGGSENMFFETYGAGRTVELALERGWLVVAPRQGLFGVGMDADAIVRVMGRYYEIDRGRVFLMGHSMGAVQVARQVSRRPDLAAAAVALGGGGSVPKGDPNRKNERSTAWFVGAGEQDFGRAGAAALARRLTEAQARSTYREYPDVEHLAIVQAALDDVFQFLDEAAKSK